MKLLIAALALFLAGCAGQVRTVTVVQKVEVSVPCKVATIEKPVMPLQEASVHESFGSKLKKGLAEIEIRKGYEEKLEAGVRSCQ